MVECLGDGGVLGGWWSAWVMVEWLVDGGVLG